MSSLYIIELYEINNKKRAKPSLIHRKDFYKIRLKCNEGKS